MSNIVIEPIKALLEKIDRGEYYISEYNLFNKKGKLLGYIGKNGYKVYSVKVNGKEKKLYAHRLIFAYYHGIDELIKYESLNHIDGNKLNNNIFNLEGMSLVENSKHQWETGLAKSGSDCTQSILDEYSVSQIKKLLHMGRLQKEISNYYNVHRSTILNINLGITWKNVELDLSVEIPDIPKEIKKVRPDRILFDEDIEYIKNSIINGIHTRKELSEIFGVSYSAIRKYSTGLRVLENARSEVM